MRRNQKFLVGLASLTLFDIAAASAAPPPPMMPSWAGFYVGAHAGYRWADGTFTSAPYDVDLGAIPVSFPGRNENYGLSSGIVGMHAGYNHLINPSWLVGIEGDLTYGHGSSTQSAELVVFDNQNFDSYLFRRTSTLKLTWQATLRGRLGYISGPWLFYGTGGVAFIRAKWNDSSIITELDVSGSPLTVNPTVAAWSASNILTGGVVGFGVEYMFDPKWIGRLEYLYESFGGFNVPHGFGPQIGRVEIDDVQKVRVGISYKVGP